MQLSKIDVIIRKKGLVKLMKLTFIGAAHEVTGSCHLLQTDGKNILVDCGMEQGPDLYENPGLPIAESDVDYVLLTHAHIDHSGLLPFLTKKDSKEVYLLHMLQRISVILCCETVHIFRSLRQSGEIVKEDEQDSRNLNHCM